MTRPATEDYQQRCREALDVALAEVALYERFRSADPGPSHDLDSRYRALPILTKSDIRAHFPYGLVPRGLDLDGALERGEVSFVTTSGTADEALTNIWNQPWWNASERASWTLNSVAARVATGNHPEAILASALSVGPRSEGAPLPRSARTLGRFLFLNEYPFAQDWPERHEARILGELSELAPVVLEANPSLLARVARFAARQGVLPFQPELITLTYEYPSELQLKAIRQVFRAPIASSYGSTEAGYVFMQCEHGGLHQNAEFCRVDLLPFGACEPGSDGAPIALGRLVVTTFHNRWSPLLRFDIGDLGRRATEPCPCGRSSGMVLSAIEGRHRSACLGAEGRLLTHRAVDRALGAVPGLCDYQLEQISARSVRLRLVAADGQGPRCIRDAGELVRELFGRDVALEIAEVPAILPERSGKFLLVKRSFPLDWDGPEPTAPALGGGSARA